MDNPLTTWFYTTGKFVTDSEKQEVTHFLLDGGKLDISKDYELFQEMYSKYIHFKNCIVERKTNLFKFFIDFDFNSTEIIDISGFIEVIQDVIENIYGVPQLCIITCADKYKEIIKSGIKYIKQGYHLHWPDILVDKYTAKAIRKNILVRMKTEFGEIESSRDKWEKIIDKCVYDANGLRIIGSDKCSISDGIKFYENRVYEVKSVYNGKNFEKELTKEYISNNLLAIRKTSVRSDVTCITPYKNLQFYEETEDSGETSSMRGFNRLDKDSNEYISIIKFFNNYIPHYKSEDIRIIQKSKDNPVYIIATKSKYCQNKGDFHSHNNIYFKLTPSGFCQKCLSESQGEFGCCRDYQSEPVPISPGLESALGWKKPKEKPGDLPNSEKFTLENILFKMENRITNKQQSLGPTKCKKNKFKADSVEKNY
tara:strand:+ start:1308 stop:2582 length:1275 start_codon:yes stop_codon:yes gene_type:complete